MSRQYSLQDLLYLMERLRHPETGCPWDLAQTYSTITPSTIEEAYEVVDAIDREDFVHLKEELGDFLFQVIFYAQLAKEEKRFDFDDIVNGLTAKLIRRHPHVFPEGTLESEVSEGARDERKVKETWENIKQEERRAKGSAGLLDDIPRALPAAIRAHKMQKRAAKIGFDWDNPLQVLEKIEEEVRELKENLLENRREAACEELGDLLFTCVNMARHLKADTEAVLRQANLKFEQRFTSVEHQLSGGTDRKYSVEELERLWQAAKQQQQ